MVQCGMSNLQDKQDIRAHLSAMWNHQSRAETNPNGAGWVGWTNQFAAPSTLKEPQMLNFVGG